MEPCGSLAPELVKRLIKRRIEDPKKLVTTQQTQLLQDGSFRTNDSLAVKTEEDAPSFIEIATLRNLLTKVPCKDKIEVTAKEKLEFMSYLRPILRDEMFRQEGNGWDFLTTHVFANQEMFRKIL